MAKALKLDYHDERTDVTLTGAILIIKTVTTQNGQSREATPPGKNKTETVVNPSEITFDVYSKLKSVEDDKVDPVFSGKRLNDIPTPLDTKSNALQALDYLKSNTFKDKNPSIVTYGEE